MEKLKLGRHQRRFKKIQMKKVLQIFQETGVYGSPAIEYYKVSDGFIEYAMPIKDNEAYIVKEISEMI